MSNTDKYRIIGYILDENNEVVEIRGGEYEKYFDWIRENSAPKKIKRTENNDIVVSTVFLSQDMREMFDGQPMVFETMVFDNKEILYCERYPTYKKALIGHNKIVDKYIV